MRISLISLLPRPQSTRWRGPPFSLAGGCDREPHNRRAPTSVFDMRIIGLTAGRVIVRRLQQAYLHIVYEVGGYVRWKPVFDRYDNRRSVDGNKGHQITGSPTIQIKRELCTNGIHRPTRAAQSQTISARLCATRVL